MRRLLAAAVSLTLVGTLATAAAPDPPALSLPGDLVAEAQDASGADVTYSAQAAEGLVITCDYPSGAQGTGTLHVTARFPLGATTVSCSAVDSGGVTVASGSFLVTVRDTTPPTVSVPPSQSVSTEDPAGATVSFAAAAATDSVDGILTPTCDHVSGSVFPIGATTVTCTATDTRGNTGSESFTVTVTLVDTTPPVLTLPGDQTVQTEDPSGEAVSFAVSATDNLDGSITPACDHAPGSLFAVGTTVVGCTATDSHGNVASGSFNVTVVLVDTKPPVLTMPDDQTVQTEDPAGATVAFTVSATDNVDGSISPSCDHAPGSLFPVGATVVTCSATDSHGNTAAASFTVTVVLVDLTPPALTGVPSSFATEANGPAGSVVIYTPPSAVDNVDGPIAGVGCTPASGATFPLGPTTVTCSAVDAHGNTGTASFTVTVRDTTPPVLSAPGDVAVDATTPTGIPATIPAVATFLGTAVAQDLVDPRPTVTNDGPGFFPLGLTNVTFTAQDDAGNVTRATAGLTVRPQPAPGTPPPPPLPPPPDRTPPDDVGSLTAAVGPGLVRLAWSRPKAADFEHVVVLRSEAQGGSDAQPVYTGTDTSYLDHDVRNGVAYRYLVVSYDRSGNRSAGVAVVAQPKTLLLVAPPDGAKLRSRPVLRWAPVVGASYYNVQLFRGRSKLVKIFTTWPRQNQLKLPRTWRYAGLTHRLSPGLYRWYVWPGFGGARPAKYGELLGDSTFEIVR